MEWKRNEVESQRFGLDRIGSIGTDQVRSDQVGPDRLDRIGPV